MRWMMMGLLLMLGGWFTQSAVTEPAEAVCCCEDGGMAHCTQMQNDQTSMTHDCCGQADCHCAAHCTTGHAASALIIADGELPAVQAAGANGRCQALFIPSPWLKTPAKPPRV